MENYPAGDIQETDAEQNNSDYLRDNLDDQELNPSAGQNIDSLNRSSQMTMTTLSGGNRVVRMSHAFNLGSIETEVASLSGKQRSNIFIPLGELSDKCRPASHKYFFGLDETPSVHAQINDCSYQIRPYVCTRFFEEIVVHTEVELFSEDEHVSSETLSCTSTTCLDDELDDGFLFDPDSSDFDDNTSEDVSLGRTNDEARLETPVNRASLETQENGGSIERSDVQYIITNEARDIFLTIRQQMYIFSPNNVRLTQDSRNQDTENSDTDTASEDEDSEAEFFQPRIIPEDYVSPKMPSPKRDVTDKNYKESSSEDVYHDSRVVDGTATPVARPRASSNVANQNGRRLIRRRLFVNDESIEPSGLGDSKHVSNEIRYYNHNEDSSAVEDNLL